LDRRHSGVVQALTARVNKDSIDIMIEPSGGADCSLEIWGAERRKELFEEEFGLKVNLLAPLAV
jgi:hypothetical protein